MALNRKFVDPTAQSRDDEIHDLIGLLMRIRWNKLPFLGTMKHTINIPVMIMMSQVSVKSISLIRKDSGTALRLVVQMVDLRGTKKVCCDPNSPLSTCTQTKLWLQRVELLILSTDYSSWLLLYLKDLENKSLGRDDTSRCSHLPTLAHELINYIAFFNGGGRDWCKEGTGVYGKSNFANLRQFPVSQGERLPTSTSKGSGLRLPPPQEEGLR